MEIEAKPPESPLDHHDNARTYYGQTLTSSEDLKTSACCTLEAIPAYHRQLLTHVHEEIRSKFYGCGSPLPPSLEGQVVLDLGCGTGRDAYVASQLVGSSGRVLGVDMTEAQLETARKHLPWHMERFGYAEPNVEFRHGIIEDLSSAGVKDHSVDVVISNCVVNLSPSKESVMAEAFRVLRSGGELYFSDVYADRRVPTALQHDPILHGECLSGAFYDEDFRRLLLRLGCSDYRIVSEAPIEISDPALQEKLGSIQFFSRTIRAFKLSELEDSCEDYGQTATYLGTIKETPDAFVLDAMNRFEKGVSQPVSGNTALMLQASRYASHFTVQGDRSVHYGAYTPAGGDEPCADEGCCS